MNKVVPMLALLTLINTRSCPQKRFTRKPKINCKGLIRKAGEKVIKSILKKKYEKSVGKC
jgi:hypothetical protein